MTESPIVNLVKTAYQHIKPEDFLIGTPLTYKEGVEYHNVPNFTEEYVKAALALAEGQDPDVEALYTLGVCYFYGLGGLPINHVMSFNYSVRAAEKGHYKAMYNAATWIFTIGYEKMNESLIARAIALFAAVAETGFIPAKYWLWRVDQFDLTYQHFYPSDSMLTSRFQLLQEAAAAKYPLAVKALSMNKKASKQKVAVND